VIVIWYVNRSPGLHLRDRREIQLFGLKDQVLGGQFFDVLNEEIVSTRQRPSESLVDRTKGLLELQFGQLGGFGIGIAEKFAAIEFFA
jgi:hypothetical protein